jgi:hypothetical protein
LSLQLTVIAQCPLLHRSRELADPVSPWPAQRAKLRASCACWLLSCVIGIEAPRGAAFLAATATLSPPPKSTSSAIGMAPARPGGEEASASRRLLRLELSPSSPVLVEEGPRGRQGFNTKYAVPVYRRAQSEETQSGFKSSRCFGRGHSPQSCLANTDLICGISNLPV